MPSTESLFRVVIFADCHLPVTLGHPEFEAFLHTFEQVAKQTETIVLLGDVFRVWAAVPVFDHENGYVLLETIRSVSDNCRVIMVEGNWDFYIKKAYFDAFDRVSEDAVVIESEGERLVFVHGHMDHLFSDRLLMRLLKSRLVCTLFRWKRFFGLARKLNRKFQEGGLSKTVQPDELIKVADRLTKRFPGSDRIFVGHFHQSWQKGIVTGIPDYHSTRSFLGLSNEPALYRIDSGRVVPVYSDVFPPLSGQDTKR
ncbi:MAG: hypothetical protein GXO70_00385 [Acidobacteria bacterium]|nr:hypothetical protein [Acidobacteriota bacterium]